MSKPRIKDIRRAYVLDILIRFESKYENGIPQKMITERVLIENENINDKIETQKDEIKRKVNIAASKTINALERDGIITVTSPRVPGTRGANPNIISLNKTPEALFKILLAYDEDLLGEGLAGSRPTLVYKYNMLISDYYKELVNMELVKELTSPSMLPFNEKDKKLIYHLIMSSPEALKSLFLMERFNELGKLTDFEKYLVLEEGEEVFKKRFMASIQINFIRTVAEYYDIPNFNIEININAKFKDKDTKKEVYEFSNNFEGEGVDSPIDISDCNFI
jgi:hypothetical protein